MFTDGGIRFVKLDAKSGNLILETVLNEIDPDTGKNLQEYIKALDMPTALSDILSTDGKFLYMRTQRLTLDGKRDHVAMSDVDDQDGEGVHLFSAAGFLDDTWFHRAYWMYGKSLTSGASRWFLAARRVPAGKILAFDETHVYGFGRKQEYYRWTSPLKFHMFSAEKNAQILSMKTGKPATEKEVAERTEKCVVPAIRTAFKWSKETDILGRAIVKADGTVFVAGPVNFLNEEQAYARLDDAETKKQFQDQIASLSGKKGGALIAFSAENGNKLAEYKLPSPPVFDGMIAGAGNIYISAVNGEILCIGGEK